MKLSLKKKLPDDMPGLIEAAVADARKIAKSKRYKFNMSRWHEPNGKCSVCMPNGKCSVCMAGAIIACRTNAKPSMRIDLDDFDSDSGIYRKLAAINAVRMGMLGYAYGCLYQNAPANVDDVCRYIEKRINRNLDRAPWPVYLKAAKMLREGSSHRRASGAGRA